ncbi:MAG: hypothetical protein PHQ86_07540 [Dehalococcoidales bacterium]|nr:hypothetical protein [Dehalococcoidales bacterium]
MKILPKTTLGKWAIGLSIAFIFLIGMKIAHYFHFPLPIPTPAIAVLGIVGLVIGLLAVFRNKDRAILNFLPLIVGVIILLWAAAEIIFPH